MKSNSESPEALVARQRAHRLEKRVRPKVVAASNADPWVIADQALDSLDRIRPLLAKFGAAREDLDQAVEALKQLAWGPEVLAPEAPGLHSVGRLRR